MARRPIVLIHGYSSKGSTFHTWIDKLVDRGWNRNELHVITYESLTNEVSIPDIAEGFDRALRERVGLNSNEEFDAFVHSTGMLVIRTWLTAYAHRSRRLKHLIGLAPATFGSPLAHKGRSWLGGIFAGRKEWGPDFLEAGKRILDNLELGSRYTWELAEKDMIGDTPVYGPSNITPYVFIFCGTEGYHGIKQLVSEPGTDGTVRLAGCALNTRKIILDLTKNVGEKDRICVPDWSNVSIPLIPVKGANHGTIMSEPADGLVDLVVDALGVDDALGLKNWSVKSEQWTRDTKATLTKWQQFVVRAVDERGEAIKDYYIRLEGTRDSGSCERIENFDLDVHAYGEDVSFRNFHVNLSELRSETLQSLTMRVIASSGSSLVSYQGYVDGSDETEAKDDSGTWQAKLDLTRLLNDQGVKFFYPFTTTLIELRLNREPLPLIGPNKVCWFD